MNIPKRLESQSQSVLVKKIDPRTRHTLRGLKKCSSCGEINGQRALLCRNISCELRKTLRPYDPVQLVTAGSECKIYSLRIKERDALPRNFVTITDVTLALEQNSAIVSRNAICFVDICKANASDCTNIACKHIKACSGPGVVNIPLAESYQITREVLWNLNIGREQKQQLWNLYKEDENQIPTIQRLNASTFAVKCVQSKIFPAGRLHVTASCNGLTTKKSTHGCACKKLKIIVEPDNSVVMQEDICDHLLLVLAAVLSKQNGKTMYSNFTNALKSYWMPMKLDTPLMEQTHEDAFLGMSINIGGNFKEKDEQDAPDDIFIFGDEFLVDDKLPLPDFSDIILDLGTPDTIANTATTVAASSTPIGSHTADTSDVLYAGDPNLVSSCDIYEDVDMNFDGVNTSSPLIGHKTDLISTVDTSAATHLELTDCNIELILNNNHFQLTDQIDLCSEDITIPIVSSAPISVLAPSVFSEPMRSNLVGSIDTIPMMTTAPAPTAAQSLLNHSVLKASQVVTQLSATPATTTTLPPIEMPTIAVVKKQPIKASDVVTEIKTRKYPLVPAKRALIATAKQAPGEFKSKVETVGLAVDTATGPALAYTAWLDYVIEMINDSVEIRTEPLVSHSFHIHEETFAHLGKSFSVGVKRRIPNQVTVIKQGKYKGLMKYVWYFTTASTVRRIFNSQNISIQVERVFERLSDGSFVPYVRKPVEPSSSKKRRIYPKLSLYTAYIYFDCSKSRKTGLKLEWIPGAFPRSNFGIFNIEFSLAIREPQNL